MRKIFVLLCAISFVLGMSQIASAAVFSFDMGANSELNLLSADPGLVFETEVNPNLDTVVLDIAEGETKWFNLGRIRATETAINPDDTIAKNAQALVDFDVPELQQTVDGQTQGWRMFWGILQGYDLVWEDPQTIDFGVGGQFILDLTDVNSFTVFGIGLGCWHDVCGSIELVSCPIPEPGTLLLGLTGLLGLITTKKFF